MPAAAGFPEAFQKAFTRGDLYYRINQTITDYLTTYPFIKQGLLPIVPWGIVVGPNSNIDQFSYNDYDEVNTSSLSRFSTRSPLLNISTTIDAPTSRQINILNEFPNTVSAVIDLFVYMRPVPGVVPYGTRAPAVLNNGTVAYGAGNGLVSDTTDTFRLLFGRKYMDIAWTVSSAAVVRLDIYGLNYANSLSPSNILIFSYTTNGVAGDGAAGSFPIPDNLGEIRTVITKISGAAGDSRLNNYMVD